MNTDVIFLTMMMDILTGPIPAAIADEEGVTKARGYVFFVLFFWTECACLFVFIQVN